MKPFFGTVVLFGLLNLLLIVVSASEFHDDLVEYNSSISGSSSSSISGSSSSNSSTASIVSCDSETSILVHAESVDSEPSVLVHEESTDSSEHLKVVQESPKSLESSKLLESPKSQLSSLTSSSPELMKFIQYDEEHTRPRGSSFHTTASSKKDLHVSIGWVQYSDDAWMPTMDMEDNCVNREHIRNSMLADARHGNLEYFRCLKAVLDRFDESNPRACDSLHINSDLYELDFYNPSSMIFAAVQGDNVDLFLDVMAWKGITFNDLDPGKEDGGKRETGHFSPSSYPPKRKSILDDESDSDGDEESNELPACDETIFGQAIVRNSIEIFRLLLDHGIRDNFPENSQTALHLAIKHNHEMIVRLLLDFGGSQIDRVNGAYQSPLMAAVLVGSPKIVRILLERGAFLLHTDFARKNVLHYAAENGNLEILALLKESLEGLSTLEQIHLVNGQDLKRDMPVHLAVNANVFAILVNEFGADPTIPNAQNRLPKYYK